MEMITGRAWRALRVATDLVKRFVPGSRRASSDSIALTEKVSYLVCDDPSPKDKTPRSGMVTVRGWCLCEGGVDHVQVRASGLPPVEVTPSIARPDVKKTHSELDTTGTLRICGEHRFRGTFERTSHHHASFDIGRNRGTRSADVWCSSITRTGSLRSTIAGSRSSRDPMSRWSRCGYPASPLSRSSVS